jgi:L-lactate utilization protein LutC
MIVHRCRRAELPATLAGVLASLGARSVTLAAAAGSPLAAAAASLAAAGVTVVDWRRAAGLEAHYDVDAGLTDVAAAIAETGSLVVCSGPGRSRGPWLVPPVHVAVVEEAQILPDLVDLWSGGAALPAATTIITGPSKTADIEGILVTGVHGPGAVHVIVLEG